MSAMPQQDMPMMQPPIRGKLVRGANGFAVRAKLPPAPDAAPKGSPTNVSLRVEGDAMVGVVEAMQQLTVIGQQIVMAIGQLASAMAQIQPPVVNVEPTPFNVKVAAPTVNNNVTAQPGEVVVRNTVDATVQLPQPRPRTATITNPDGSTSEVSIQ